MIEVLKDKDRRAGVVGTTTFHVMLLLLFLYFGFTVPDPLPEGDVLTIVNFGTSEQGAGEVQPDKIVSDQVQEDARESLEEQVTPNQPSQADQQAITQDAIEAPAMSENKQEQPEKQDEQEEERQVEQELANAMNQWNKNSSSNSGGQGPDNVSGDKGSPDGSKEAENYGTNSDPRGGGGIRLSGRTVIIPPKEKNECNETGIVVVEIVVDKYGKVTRATPGAKGTQVSDRCLLNFAKKLALKYKFNASPNAREEQKGTITFDFTPEKAVLPGNN